MPDIPSPDTLHPVAGYPRVIFLKTLICSPNIEVGDYTYYDHPGDPAAFERESVLYAYGPERLVIGRYCALATGVRFLMSGANHPTAGVSTFPFAIFGGAWSEQTLDLVRAIPSRGDTIVGNDVWIGYEAVVMPGVRIGDGAIVAAEAVVARDVPPYGVVAGNPARLVRTRFDETDIDRLLRAAWWDWPVELVTEHARLIMAGRPAGVEAIARARATAPGRRDRQWQRVGGTVSAVRAESGPSVNDVAGGPRAHATGWECLRCRTKPC